MNRHTGYFWDSARLNRPDWAMCGREENMFFNEISVEHLLIKVNNNYSTVLLTPLALAGYKRLHRHHQEI